MNNSQVVYLIEANRANKVTCLLCGKDFREITWTHLKYEHGTTIGEYKRLFPDAQLHCDDIRNSHPKGEDHHMYGKHWSKEIRQKQSKNKLGKTWEEIYGKETAKRMREQQSKNSKEWHRTHKNPSTRPEVREKIRQTIIQKYKDNPKLREQARTYVVKYLKTYKIPFQSSIEENMFKALNEVGIKTKQQHPININTPSFKRVTVADFAMPKKKVAIYCDGCYWHSCPVCFDHEVRRGVRGGDASITKKLENMGWKVLRFWEHEINDDVMECVEVVKRAL